MNDMSTGLQEGGNNGGQEYREPLKDWATRARVRGTLGDFNLEHDRLVFSPDQCAAWSHPKVQKLGERALTRLLAREMHSFLLLTDVHENEAIIPAAWALARSPQRYGISPKAGRNARLLIVDEGFHSHDAVELAAAIADRYEIHPIGPNMPRFLRCFSAITTKLPEAHVDHARVALAGISEVSITSLLRRVPQDLRVATAVRRVMADHLADEGLHAAYFSYVLQRLWPTWSREHRHTLGPLFAPLLRLFLEPDVGLITLWLEDIGLEPDDADTVIRDCYSPARITADIRKSSAVPLHILHRIGVFDDRASRTAAVRDGLID